MPFLITMAGIGAAGFRSALFKMYGYTWRTELSSPLCLFDLGTLDFVWG